LFALTILPRCAPAAVMSLAPVWTRQFGTSSDELGGRLTSDGQGGVVIVGESFGSLFAPNAGGYDGFAARYNPAGNTVWAQSFSAPALDFPSDVASDGAGSFYVSAGGNGATVVKLNAATGATQWTQTMGSGGGTSALAVATDRSGNVAFSGLARGSVAG